MNHHLANTNELSVFGGDAAYRYTIIVETHQRSPHTLQGLLATL